MAGRCRSVPRSRWSIPSSTCRPRKRPALQHHTDTDMKFSKAISTLGCATIAMTAAPLTTAAEAGWYIGANGGETQADVDKERVTDELLDQGFATTFLDENERDMGF